MHIEPGVVTGAKIALSYVTAAGAATWTLAQAAEAVRAQGVASLAARSAIATAAVFTFFEVLPHAAVGVSEVHLILGSTLFLLLGAGPAAIGLAAGLLLQGLLFAPADLPQYGMNVTTLLLPLFALQAIAHRVIAPGTAYVDLAYRQVFALSLTYQAGVVAWVAFWAFYGQGFAVAGAVASFGAAYVAVLLIEPLVDLAVLAVAKSARGLSARGFLHQRLHHAI